MSAHRRIWISEARRPLALALLSRCPGLRLDLRLGLRSLFAGDVVVPGEVQPEVALVVEGQGLATRVSLDMPDSPEVEIDVRAQGPLAVIQANREPIATVALPGAGPVSPIHAETLVCLGPGTVGATCPSERVRRLWVLLDPELQRAAGLLAFPNLGSLTVNGCDRLEDVRVLTNLEQLSSLDLGRCDALRQVADLAGLAGLERLFLEHCGALQSADLAGLSRLMRLHLAGCPSLETLRGPGSPSWLIELTLSRCGSLRAIEGLIGSPLLTSLDLSGCRALEGLDGLRDLDGLETLNLSGCESLVDLQGIGGLEALTSLDLSGCEALASLEPLRGLRTLRLLDLSSCRHVEDFAPLASLRELRSLMLVCCRGLTETRAMASLDRLEELSLGGCVRLESIDGLGSLERLGTLSLHNCLSLESLEPLEGLAALTSLDLRGCGRVRSIEPLAGLSGLRELDLSQCEALSSLEGLSELGQLCVLNASGCEEIDDLLPLAALTGLTSLELDGCHKLRNVAVLRNLTRLTRLDLGDCPALESVCFLEELAALEKLDLSLPPARRTEDDSIRPRDPLRDLAAIGALGGLRELSLAGRSGITSLAALADLEALETLDLRRCVFLRAVQGASRLSKLHTLRLDGCVALRDIHELAASHGLKRLTFDVDPAGAAGVLAACATARGDVEHIAAQAPVWLEVLSHEGLAPGVVGPLSHAFALGAGQGWGSGALEILVTVVGSGDPIPADTVREVYRACLALGDPELRSPLEAAAATPGARRGDLALLEPWVATLGDTPRSARGWACERLAAVADLHRGNPVLERLAPSLCLANAQLGAEGEAREWLARSPTRISARDQVHLALFGWETRRGNRPRAQAHLAQIRDRRLREKARQGGPRAGS